MAITGPKVQMPAAVSDIFDIRLNPDGSLEGLSLKQDWAAFFNALQQISFNSSRSGTTSSRPTSSLPGRFIGQPYFDTNLDNPVWWDGTNWVPATGGSGSVHLSDLLAANNSNNIDNQLNPQVWNWTLTSDSTTAFEITEANPSTNGTNDQFLFDLGTANTSTAYPLRVFVQGAINNPNLQITTEGAAIILGRSIDATHAPAYGNAGQVDTATYSLILATCDSAGDASFLPPSILIAPGQSTNGGGNIELTPGSNGLGGSDGTINFNRIAQVQVDNGLHFNNQSDAAGFSVGTITNAPASGGDPTFWLKVHVGTTDYGIPLWPL